MILSKGKNKGRIRKEKEREDIGNYARKKVLKFDKREPRVYISMSTSLSNFTRGDGGEREERQD